MQRRQVVLGCRVVGALMLAFMMGCATSARQTEIVAPQISKTDMKYTHIHVMDYTVAPKVEADEKALELSNFTLHNTLKKRGIYESVTNGTPAAGVPNLVIVECQVTEMDIVGGTSRFLVGALAGSSDMKVNVKIYEQATNNVIAQSEISTSNSAFGATWSGGSSDRDLPIFIAESIAAYVINATSTNPKKDATTK